jgi:7-cyano-7-deazaguanine synthase
MNQITQMNKLVLAFSGGADSTVLLHMAVDRGYKNIHTLTFDYGQRHNREIDCVKSQIRQLQQKYPSVTITNKLLDVTYIKDISPTSSLTNKSIDNPDINKIAGDAQPVSYVPFRNMMFLSICCAYAESMKANTVWYGAAQIDSAAGYWDTTDSFIDFFNTLIEQNRTHNIKLEAPLIDMSKSEIILEGTRIGVSFGDTWTCYSNDKSGLADATTPSSSLRLAGFIQAKLQDPIRYVQQDHIDILYAKHECKKIA